MSHPKGIMWLSSYPKSGNTWFRIFLSRVLNQSAERNYINDIDAILGSPMVANRSWMNKTLGFDSTLLTPDEVDELRPGAYAWHAQQVQQTTYIKTHDAYTLLQDKRPLIPTQGCLGAVYFIRNPLDVAISLAHHVKCPIDWSIQMMGNKQFSVPLATNIEKQVQQHLLSWSMHVQSWAADLPIKVLIVRYEDMHLKPLETFTHTLNFLNLDIAPDLVQEAIEDVSFNKLQHYEKRFGFVEKPAIEGQFFRKGIIGDWKNTLSDAQIQRVIHDHGEVMRTYHYLDENNQPIT
jgi:hypothetical protein